MSLELGKHCDKVNSLVECGLVKPFGCRKVVIPRNKASKSRSRPGSSADSIEDGPIESDLNVDERNDEYRDGRVELRAAFGYKTLVSVSAVPLILSSLAFLRTKGKVWNRKMLPATIIFRVYVEGWKEQDRVDTPQNCMEV